MTPLSTGPPAGRNAARTRPQWTEQPAPSICQSGVACAAVLVDNSSCSRGPSRRKVMTHPGALDDRSLLLTLEECSRLVSHSHDPHETLSNIVRLIRDRFQTAVCSVYLLEPDTG